MKKTILEKLCEMNKCQGGTIHQMRKDIKITMRNTNLVVFKFGGKVYCANRFGLVIKMQKGVCKGYLKDKDIINWFLEEVGADKDGKAGNKITYKYWDPNK